MCYCSIVKKIYGDYNPPIESIEQSPKSNYILYCRFGDCEVVGTFMIRRVDPQIFYVTFRCLIEHLHFVFRVHEPQLYFNCNNILHYSITITCFRARGIIFFIHTS